jgi:hypothetical protein
MRLAVTAFSFSVVTPAKAGVQGKRRIPAALDARLHGHDNEKILLNSQVVSGRA